MYFCFNESHSKNKSNTTYIILSSCNDLNSKNFNPTMISFNDFFEKLEPNMLNNILNELNNILDYSKKDCINSSVWLNYKISHSLTIPKIGERYLNLISKTNSNDGEGIEITYYKNKRPNKILFEKKHDFFQSKTPNLLHNLPPNKGAEFNLTIKKEAICNNDIELLYAFLQCLFNSPQTTYYVKKCKYCKRFYIDSYYKTSYCKRTNLIKNKLIPCCEIKHFIKKQNEYKKFLVQDRILQNKISDNFDDSILFNYLNEREMVINTCINTRDLTILEDFIKNSKTNYF